MRKAISLLLIASFLVPSVAFSQQSPAAQTIPAPGAPPPSLQPAPRSPGVFAPINPTRTDTGSLYGIQTRAIAGPDYRLGPGDVVDVQIVGRLEVNRHQVVVDPEGGIALPPLGTIVVGGRTLLEATRLITARARAVFRFADVSISVQTPRAFEAIVSGEVERPGSLQVTATHRLHEVILATGGVTPRGSVRHVQLTQNGVSREVDLLLFELKGDLGQNPFVQEGMRIHVPARRPAVTLQGAVRRPGEYELPNGGSLRDLLDLTGGLAPTGAASEARLTRVGPDGRKETSALDVRTADVPLQGGDVLYVPPLTLIQDVVEVRGAFNGSGEGSKTTTAGKPTVIQRLELARGERVKDIVIKAGGAAPFADLRLAYVDRADAGPAQRIPVDLHRLLVDKDEMQNILVQNGDVLVLPIMEDKVYIVGEVKNPGPQDFRPDLTPREYLASAGGPGVRAKITAATVTFRNGRTYAMAEAPPLEAGAMITVPEVAVRWWQDYVTIASAVANLITAYTGIFLLFNASVRD